VLEVLRQPLEDKVVTISRAQGTLTLPASFHLNAPMNRCPKGYTQTNNLFVHYKEEKSSVESKFEKTVL